MRVLRAATFRTTVVFLFFLQCSTWTYSRRDASGTCLISLTPFIFILLFSTVTYSVKVYGPVIEAENILRLSIWIGGEDNAQTEIKYLTDRTTAVRGYEMYLLYG